jgi:hypothetical protein
MPLRRLAFLPAGALSGLVWAAALTLPLAAQAPPEESPAPVDPAAPASGARLTLGLDKTLAKQPKHFFTAAGEVVLLELLPWAYDRYVADEEFARISFHTIRENFRKGFTYDSDHFSTNQAAHPYHGSLYFDAARSNGYGFWESGAFTLAGSLLWECCMETTAPSVNDLVNTTLGGMTRGEISHRLSVMILDNTASGSNRLWRELGAAIVNPVGAVTRLLHGDTSRDFPNPEERFPRGFALSRSPRSTATPSAATSRSRSTPSGSDWTSIFPAARPCPGSRNAASSRAGI